MSYNLTQLRILWEIASDGLVANNFIAHSLVPAGDYGITNLKTDIVEQKWRGFSGSISQPIPTAFFIVDTGMTFDPILSPSKAIFVDTMALLNTNLTQYATIQVWAYGTASSSAIRDGYQGQVDLWSEFTTRAELLYNGTMPSDPYEKNWIWIRSSQPTKAYRHWGIMINDPNNPDPYVEVGRFVAGQSTILTELENYTSNVKYSENNFKDEAQITGFSWISNNRALKKKITLEFDNLNMNGDNYKMLRKMIRYIRDTKKALVLPDPTDVYRFNLYAKLEKMPEYAISYVDAQNVYASFGLEFNEGK